jgi:hypothetical protein
MANAGDGGNGWRKPVVLLRGEQLKQTGTGGDVPRLPLPRDTEVPAGRKDGESIYGVPISAIQSCCGRGCKHCRIYWNRLKP